MSEFVETLHQGFAQTLTIDEPLYESRTEHQHVTIFRNSLFGRVLTLDGVVQTTEADEFIYHEMLAHVPLLAHGRARRVLIVGGGDGGLLREVVKHADIDAITQVEIDQSVIELCREYLPAHSAGAFDDPRVEIVIADGCQFLQRSDAQFDVIISDSTDPIGPGEALFTGEFYAAVRSRLAPGGIFVAQNGVTFVQLDELATTAGRLRPLFGDWHFYRADVPTYSGGAICLAWASDDPGARTTPVDTLEQRFDASGLATRYYTPEVHWAAFALPRYVRAAIGLD